LSTYTVDGGGGGGGGKDKKSGIATEETADRGHGHRAKSGGRKARSEPEASTNGGAGGAKKIRKHPTIAEQSIEFAGKRPF